MCVLAWVWYINSDNIDLSIMGSDITGPCHKSGFDESDLSDADVLCISMHAAAWQFNVRSCIYALGVNAIKYIA